MIIAIAVGCSVVATIGVLIGGGAIQGYQMEQESIEYQKDLAEQDKIIQHQVQQLEYFMKKFEAKQMVECNERRMLSLELYNKCISDLDETMYWMSQGEFKVSIYNIDVYYEMCPRTSGNEEAEWKEIMVDCVFSMVVP